MISAKQLQVEDPYGNIAPRAGGDGGDPVNLSDMLVNYGLAGLASCLATIQDTFAAGSITASTNTTRTYTAANLGLKPSAVVFAILSPVSADPKDISVLQAFCPANDQVTVTVINRSGSANAVDYRLYVLIVASQK